jgi:hypothetical protein
MNLQTQKLLPAVLMSLSSISAVAATGHVAMAASKHSVVPAVLSNQLITTENIPEKLRTYEKGLASKIDFPMSRRDFCGTLTGSGRGWDDSGSDCF